MPHTEPLNQLEAWQAARLVARRKISCVALVREAGAVLLGKTVTTELANMAPGVTRNPHNLDHTPGGFSSGSAAAVADGMLPLALGTQTAGSVIRPAAFCGVAGFKPSHGRVPQAGVQGLSGTLDTIGCFGRSVRDVALLGAVLTSDATLFDLAAFEQLAPPRIGLCQTPEWPAAAEDTAGLPCIHLPFAKGKNGLPVGLQLIGRFGDDQRLLLAAHWVHTHVGNGEVN